MSKEDVETFCEPVKGMRVRRTLARKEDVETYREQVTGMRVRWMLRRVEYGGF